MVDFITAPVGWKIDGRYNALVYEVNEAWERGTRHRRSVTDLRQSVANDPKLEVLIAHGWDDLSCPFSASRLIVDQMPSLGEPNRVQLRVYPGGHMFYAGRTAPAFKRDAMEAYGLR